MDELFSNMFYSIAHWRPEEFELKLPNGHIDPALPFSNIYLTVAMTLGYYAMILILQFVMKNQKPFSLRPLFALHNGMLSFCSLVLLVLIMQNLIPLWSGGWWYAICTGEKYPNYNKLHLLYYINYLFKYYELLDTVFLVLSKKHLEFLHWYHHSMTLWLTFSQLYGQSTVQWVPIVLNLMVHVLMYYYYCRSALGAQIWWKKYLTAFQITQFFIDLIVIYYCMTTFIIGQYFSHLGYNIYCNASEGAASIGGYILTSYFFLFVHFYKKTYKKKPEETNGHKADETKKKI